MQRGDIWFAATPGGDRPVLVLTRDPVAAVTRTKRGLISELDLSAAHDDVPTNCVVNFDNLHTLARTSLRRRVTSLSPARLAEACLVLAAATGC
jgi:mRNA interferase MazF